MSNKAVWCCVRVLTSSQGPSPQKRMKSPSPQPMQRTSRRCSARSLWCWVPKRSQPAWSKPKQQTGSSYDKIYVNDNDMQSHEGRVKITYYMLWTWPKWVVPYRLCRFVLPCIGCESFLHKFDHPMSNPLLNTLVLLVGYSHDFQTDSVPGLIYAIGPESHQHWLVWAESPNTTRYQKSWRSIIICDVLFIKTSRTNSRLNQLNKKKKWKLGKVFIPPPTHAAPFHSAYAAPFHRRKFRSQTSDNMDKWKAEMGRVCQRRREEKKRREEERD